MKPSVLMKYGYIINQRRRRLDLTVTELAKQVGISRNYLGMIERGTAGDPSFRIMIDLWEAVGLTMNDHLKDFDDVEIFSKAICPHCGGSIKLSLTKVKDNE